MKIITVTLFITILAAMTSGFEEQDVHSAEDELVAQQDTASVFKINAFLDIVLGMARFAFEEDGEINLKLPNVVKDFSKKYMNGTFTLSDGTFTNLATLHRTGDAQVYKKGSRVGVDVSMGLSKVEAVYKKYQLDVVKIHQSGMINASIGENSLSLGLGITYSPKCNISIDYIHFDKLEKVDIKITGLGAFQLMFNEITKWLTDNFTGPLKTLVNDKIEEKLGRIVEKADICQYVPFI